MKKKEVSVVVTPAKLLPWISQNEKEKSIVLLDLEVDNKENDLTRFDLNVVFKAIPVKKGIMEKVEYYIGTTGAEISTDFSNGQVVDHSKAILLNVDYINDNPQKGCQCTIKPEFSKKSAGAETKFSPGQLKYENSVERNYSSKYQSQERVLSTVNEVSSLKWVLNLPLGNKIIRDFLLGNIYLYVVFKWLYTSKNKNGNIIARPLDIRFFDENRKHIEHHKSLLMLFKLWQKRIKLKNQSGIKIKISL